MGRHRQRPGIRIMPGIDALEDSICTVHAKNADKKQNFENQNQVGIAGRPAFHFRFLKARHSHKVPPDKKNHGGDKGQDRQHFDGAYQGRVDHPEFWYKKAMYATKSVNDYFDQLNLRDDECDV